MKEKIFRIRKEGNDNKRKGEINYHFITEGLTQHLDCELEITLPVCDSVANKLLNDLGNNLLEKKALARDKVELSISNKIKMMLVKTVSRFNSEVNVLRVVFADMSGKYPGDDGCHEIYNNQI